MLSFFQKIFCVLFIITIPQLLGQTDSSEYHQRNIILLSSGIGFPFFGEQNGYIYSVPIKPNSLTNSIPISFSYFFNIVSNLFIGGDIEFSMTPYKVKTVTGEEEIWKWEDDFRIPVAYNTVKSIREINQTIISVKTFYIFGKKSIVPFVGGGVGIYFGSISQNSSNGMGYENCDFNTNIGFQLSSGLIYKINELGIFMTLNYNIISLSLAKDELIYTEVRTTMDPSSGRITKRIALSGLPYGRNLIGFNNFGIKIGFAIFFSEFYTKL